MITAISIENFKGIREIRDLPLDSFHVLVGPNASGKTTFLEAIDFIRACLVLGPRQAVESLNVPDFNDLTFMRRGGKIVFGLWLDLSEQLVDPNDSLLHYRLVLKKDNAHGASVYQELLRRYLIRDLSADGFEPKPGAKAKRLLGKRKSDTDFYLREDSGQIDSFAFAEDKLTLAETRSDLTKYPTANAAKKFLLEGVRFIQLNSRAMRLPCPATKGVKLELDGSNLARTIGLLRKVSAADTKFNRAAESRGPEMKGPDDEAEVFEPLRPPMEQWIRHLRYALPDLEDIGWDKRYPDNAEYIVLKYADGLNCPSWLASDGTLRMLALSILAFLPASDPAIYMVEEPENGVHPKALEIILGALQAIPRGQVMVATHSPLVVQQVGLKPLLCFSRGENGVQIVRGDQHPALKDWDGTPDLATMFAGVLE